MVLSKEDRAEARKKQNRELGEYHARQQRMNDAKQRQRSCSKQKPQSAYRAEVRST